MVLCAAGQALWKEVLRDFWAKFEQAVNQTSGVRITEVINVLDPVIGQHFLPLKVIRKEASCSVAPWKYLNTLTTSAARIACHHDGVLWHCIAAMVLCSARKATLVPEGRCIQAVTSAWECSFLATAM